MADKTKMDRRRRVDFRRINEILQEFSIPLLFGVVVALLWANVDYEGYAYVWEYDLLQGGKFLGHTLTPHFIVNDIFMVFFFGIAAVEIAVAFQKGGSLNPIGKAISPVLGMLGGVVGPMVVFFAFNILTYPSLSDFSRESVLRGWAIPTATDIALAWLVAKIVFGRSHPAISFLLLLAIGDDAIGLIIIAVFYPSPEYTVEPGFLIVNLLALVIAFTLNRSNVRNVFWYVLLAGVPSWLGLIFAHLHPALAMVPVVFFLPGNKKRGEKHSPLLAFEHFFKYPVDMGLLFFSLANAGVVFSNINALTWIILFSLKIGKTLGIFVFAMAGSKLGFPLPDKIGKRDLVVIGLIAGLGLTVSLFIAGEAYQDKILQGAAKMGALLSLVVIPLAAFTGKIFKIKRIK